jgi:hypothetical protein
MIPGATKAQRLEETRIKLTYIGLFIQRSHSSGSVLVEKVNACLSSHFLFA